MDATRFGFATETNRALSCRGALVDQHPYGVRVSYVLQCVIAPARALVPCQAFVNAVVADLGRGLSLVPMTPGLFDEVRGGDNGQLQGLAMKTRVPGSGPQAQPTS